MYAPRGVTAKGTRGVTGVDPGVTSSIATSNYIVLDTDEARPSTTSDVPSYADHVSLILLKTLYIKKNIVK